MTIFLLFILDAIMAAIAFFLFKGVFVPEMKKHAAYEKLSAKKRKELEDKLAVQQIFGEDISEEDLDIKPIFKRKRLN